MSKSAKKKPTQKKPTQKKVHWEDNSGHLVLEGMQKDSKYLDHVLIWIVAHGLDKKFKKCKGEEDSPNCVGVGLATSFPGKGRLCPECNKMMKRRRYAEQKKNEKKEEKKKSFE